MGGIRLFKQQSSIQVVLLVVACIGLVRIGAASDVAEEKVLVEFYSESLCPYCRNFVLNYLSKFFENGLIEIVDLRLIPFGNAHITADGTIVCQHGQDECDLNVIQTCAIHLWPNVTQWFPFIYCLEDLPREDAKKLWKTCVEPTRLDLDSIEKCYDGPLGDQLEKKFGAETDSLQPPHKYVPWVLVNGKQLENYFLIEYYVCEAYKGSKAISACEDGGNMIYASGLHTPTTETVDSM